MELFWIILTSVFIGIFFGGLFVSTNMIVIKNYKIEYQEWWTPRRYLILFLTITIIVAALRVAIYILD